MVLYEVLIAMGAVCCVAMTILAVVSLKNNQTISRLSRSAERMAERNDGARDRFYMSLIEKTQVQDSPESVVQLAQLHANESIKRSADAYRHDHAVESIDRVAEKRQYRHHARAVEADQRESMSAASNGME